jgi:hypothetical protein
MSKPTRPSICKQFAASAASLAAVTALTGCLSPRAGQDETTDIVLSGESGSSETSLGETGTTRGELMTTTEDPDESTVDPPDTTADEDTTDSDSSGSTTTVIPPNCGNGDKEGDEECDNGTNNANDAACTLDCHNAKCGDGHVQAGVEVCDDGVNEGIYNGCNFGCSSFAPSCGDGEIQTREGEQCDSSTPFSGCIKEECKKAASCLELKQAWGATALDGKYQIWPDTSEPALDVFCDMTTDDGGYTFVKYAAPESGGPLPAEEAEVACAGLGLHLFIPRTESHLASAVERAFDPTFKSVGNNLPSSFSDYLRIFAIYPVVAGMTCVGQPFNSEKCLEWQAADGEAYWVSDTVLSVGEPSTGNCENCSMAYYWDGENLEGYEAIMGGGVGATSFHFLCDVGDKRPMN